MKLSHDLKATLKLAQVPERDHTGLCVGDLDHQSELWEEQEVELSTA